MNKRGQGSFITIFAVVLIFVIIVLSVLQFRVLREGKPVVFSAMTTILDEPRSVPAFSLTDHHGNPFTEKDLLKKWTFLYFGYTSCPDVCPTTLGELTGADRILRKTPSDIALPRFAFISVDPERDTKEQLSNYTAYFNPDFLGVTGNAQQIRALAQPLGIVYRRSYEDASKKNYFMDHTASVLLVNPEGYMHAVMSPPHDATSIAKDFREIVHRFENPPPEK